MSDTKLIYDEESSEERMKAIGQNGNTGEHYSASTPTWTHTITGTNTGDVTCGQVTYLLTDSDPIYNGWNGGTGDPRSMHQITNESRIVSNTWSESTKKKQLPDARKHQIVSFIKSGVRLFGYVLLPFDIVAATIVLFTSEIIGIMEELV